MESRDVGAPINPEEDVDSPEDAVEAAERFADDRPGGRVRARSHRMSGDSRGDEHVSWPDGAIFAAHLHRHDPRDRQWNTRIWTVVVDVAAADEARLGGKHPGDARVVCDGASLHHAVFADNKDISRLYASFGCDEFGEIRSELCQGASNEEVAGARLRLLPVAAGARPGQRRPADLLVHGVPAGHGPAEVRGQQHRRRRGQAALADGAVAARPYWKEGQKVGYQDVGSWTILNSTPEDRAKAAWLYAQFVTSKTVDTKKSHVGLTFIRDSTIRDESFTERAPKLGGLVEFYRSPDRVRWSPTGINVPDYPKLAQIWWQQIGDVNSGAFTPQEAMDRLAAEMDDTMARMQAVDEQANVYGGCGPRLNPEVDPAEWLGKADGPKAKLENERAAGRDRQPTTRLVKRWSRGRARQHDRPPGPAALRGSSGLRARDSKARARCRRKTAGRRHDPRTQERHQARRRRDSHLYETSLDARDGTLQRAARRDRSPARPR